MGTEPDNNSADLEHCTVILEDEPSDNDELGGAHERVADGIVELIRSGKGGKIVGLEGSWGSGKSTIIRQVRRKLRTNTGRSQEDDQTSRRPDVEPEEQYAVVVFDAWAHEGDPLRRTVLEFLIQRLQPWLPADKINSWITWRDRLGRKRSSSTVKTRPVIGPWEKLLLIALSFWPIGLAMFIEGLRRGVVFWNCGVGWNQLANGGLAIMVVPLVLVCFMHCACKTRPIVHRLLRRRLKEMVPRTDDVWPLLAKMQATETNGLTTEDSDPTSVEFERKFAELMEAVLTGKRNLVIVLDNLDRVDAEDARRIWATMQTFLQSGEHIGRPWFPQLWVIVPYDRCGITRLWGSEPSARTSEGPNEYKESPQHLPLRELFLDKSLQIRFDVPPPVVSRWRERLSRLLGDAIKGHTEAELYEVVRTYSDFPGICSPTPREMTLFVNQLGSIHRQWCVPGSPEETIPLHHMAYYVLLRRTKTSREIIDGIRSKEFDVTPELIADLSALAFNVRRPEARQLLLGSDVEQALVDGSPESLLSLADIPGFWEVLDDVNLLRMVGYDGAALARAAHALQGSGLFGEPRDARRQRIAGRIADLIVAVTPDGKPRVTDWGEWNNDMALRAGDVLRLCRSAPVAGRVLEITSGTDFGPGEELDAGERPAVRWMSATLCILKLIRRLRLGDCARDGIAVPGGAVGYLAVLETASQLLRISKATVIRPAADVDEDAVVQAMIDDTVNAAPATRLAVQPLAINLLQMKKKAVSLSGLMSAAQAQLTSLDYPPESAAQLLMNLHLLRSIDEDARAALSAVNSGGFALHHLNAAVEKPNHRSVAACMIAFLDDYSSAQQPPGMPGGASSGFAAIQDGFKDECQEIAREMAVLAVNADAAAAPFGLLGGQSGPKSIGLACLRVASRSRSGRKLFSVPLLSKHWNALRTGWSTEDYSALIRALEKEASLTGSIMSGVFKPEQSGFYCSLVRVLSAIPLAFDGWCVAGLKLVDSSSWIKCLKGSYWHTRLLLALGDKGVQLDLGGEFGEALLSVCTDSMQAEALYGALRPRLSDLIAALSPAARLEFSEGLVGAAKLRDGVFAAGFFKNWKAAFKVGLSDPEPIRRALLDIVVAVVFAHRTQDSLNWADETLGNGAQLGTIASKSALDRVRREARTFGERTKQPNMREAMQRIEARAKELADGKGRKSTSGGTDRSDQ